MQYLALGIVILAGLYGLARLFATADPRTLAVWLKRAGIGLLAAGALFLVVTGRAGAVLGLLPFALPFIIQWRRLAGRFKAAAGPTPGQRSDVETGWLRMWLDHDSGTMDGEVLRGGFKDRRLSSLDRPQLMALLHMMSREDPQAVRLLESYLDRTHPDWRDGVDGDSGGSSQPGGSRAPGMTEEEALEILGLSAGAAETEVREAHKRLMLRNHPDQGGSTYIAAQINQAKDVLLKRGRRP
ncbi:molecular chaperone DnaJ [Aerophototrophica crusticola]|uniref:Molecular chaperone DnaJ n=1 Tax=Aerophototrophica crusticola TaxID=1709002 RepID=A0A858R940_9PROT|nr:molecular chaperone DnaJ [Rhodospirillaceae bacterium B3]